MMMALMMDGQSSVLYKALIDSGMGTDYHAGAGVHELGKDLAVSIGVNGVHEDRVDEVRSVIEQTLQKCATNNKWYSQLQLDSMLHQMELDMLRPKRDYGISLTPTVIADMVHGVDL